MDIKIIDVARAAKVSPTTVSRVLNNNPVVKAKTREKVLKVIEELNYVPHAAAQNLRRQRTMMIGVVVTDIRGAYHSEIIKGIQSRAAETQYKVLICDTQDNRDIELEYLRMLTDRSVDAMILVASLLSKQEVQEFVERGYPLGVIGRSIEHPNILKVYTNNVEAAQEAVTHLIEQGHRDIVFMSGDARAIDSYDRLEGYIRALRDNEIPFRPELVENGNFSEQEAYNAMRRLWDKGLQFTAVFCANDEMAIGVYRACRERGVRIPDQMAVVGVDNERISQFLMPPLSTIDQPKFEMGRTIADHLIRHMNGESLDDRRVTVLPSKLIIRQSSLSKVSVPRERR
jgi:LacI family transcriptional regulator